MARQKLGFAYLISNPSAGLHKIGVSSNPQQRVRDLIMAGTVSAVLIHEIPSNNARRLERELHEQFAKRLVSGEWFRLTPEDVTAIRAVASRDYETAKPVKQRDPDRATVFTLPAAWGKVAKRLAVQNKHPIGFCLISLIKAEAERRGFTDLPTAPWDEDN